MKVLGERVEPLGGDAWYLPGLDREADRTLLEKLEKAHVDLKTAAPGEEDKDVVEGEAQLVKLVKRVALLLMANVLQGGEPEDVKKKLLEAGLATGLVDAIIGAAVVASKAILEDKVEPKAAIQQLADKGVPVPLAVAVVEGIQEGLPEDDAKGCITSTPAT